MEFITFQKPNLNYIFFIAYFISIFLKETLEYEIFGENPLKSQNLFKMYVFNLSHILSIIPFFISKYLSKNKPKNKEQKNEENPITYIHNDISNKFKGNNLLKNTLLTSIFGFLSEAVVNIFYFINDKSQIYYFHELNIYLIFECVFIYIISFFILKSYFYKHHYLSLFINFICFSADFIFDIIKIVQEEITEYQYYIYIAIRLIRQILLGYMDCYAK